MPGNFLSSYLSASFDKTKQKSSKQGLVVTISRQKGCGAFPISKLVIEKLNELRYPLGKVIKWDLVSKEILKESAEKLKVAPEQVDRLMDVDVVQELLMNLSGKSLPSDIKIRNTIRNVIKNAASKGNIIIIGRGGVSVAREWENSFHVKLMAPFEWRVRQIASEGNMSLKEADSLVKLRDKQRETLKQYFLGVRKADAHLYDITVNVSTMQHSEVADAIFSVVKSRQDALVLNQ